MTLKYSSPMCCYCWLSLIILNFPMMFVIGTSSSSSTFSEVGEEVAKTVEEPPLVGVIENQVVVKKVSATSAAAAATTATTTTTTTTTTSRRQLEPKSTNSIECAEGDTPLLCHNMLPERCSNTAFTGCGAVCDDYVNENGEPTCDSSTFQDGSVDCKDGACFNSSFTNMDTVDCRSYHTIDPSCISSTFIDTQNVTCEENSCTDSTFINTQNINCEGDQSCHDSVFHESRVNCRSTDYGFTQSCYNSDFINSAVYCTYKGYYTWEIDCYGSNFNPCSCCDGDACPTGVPSCTEEFCFSTYLETTCKEWGNPYCATIESPPPTMYPTDDPSPAPTSRPTASPTMPPTDSSMEPSINPTVDPSPAPTSRPTTSPTNHPTTMSPTESPVDAFLISTGSPSSIPLVIAAETTQIDTSIEIVLTPEDIFGTTDAELDDGSIKIIEEPTNGDVTITTSQDGDLRFDYTPDDGFEGKDDVTISLCDVNGGCVPLRMEFTVEAEEKGSKGFYALLILLLIPILWLFREPLKRLYDNCFPNKETIPKNTGRGDRAAITGSTSGGKIPTSTGGIIDQTSFASETSIPAGNDEFEDEDSSSSDDDSSDDDDDDESSTSSDDAEQSSSSSDYEDFTSNDDDEEEEDEEDDSDDDESSDDSIN